MKLLASGEVSKKLTIRVHAISASAQKKIEAAGGTVDLLREPKVKKKKHHAAAKPEAAVEAAEAEAPEAAADAPEETATDEAAPPTEE